jgi:hypothetical protein
MRSTGSGCRNSSSPPGGTTKSPSGFAERLAIFASTFVSATPTLSGSPTSSRTSRRRVRASSAASSVVPCVRRNASSSDPGCTASTCRSKTANTARLASEYASHRLSAMSRRGHRRRARDVGMPPFTP